MLVDFHPLHVCAARDSVFELLGQKLDRGIRCKVALCVTASAQEDHLCNVWTELCEAKQTAVNAECVNLVSLLLLLA